MTASDILFVGGEDFDFAFSTPLQSGDAPNTIYVGGGSGQNRPGYSRCSLNVHCKNVSTGGTITASFDQQVVFWVSARVWCKVAAAAANGTCSPFTFYDPNGVPRITITNSCDTALGLRGTFTISTPVATLATFSPAVGFTAGSAITSPDHIDMQISYGDHGFVKVFINGDLKCDTGTVDTTSPGDTGTISQVAFSNICSSGAGVLDDTYAAWSEVIAAVTDTRSFSVVTQAASANGNVHNWTIGNAANVNGFFVNTGAPDDSTSAGQVQQYQTTQGMPAGNFGIKAVIMKAYAQNAATGPQNIQLGLRIGGGDHFSANINPGNTWTVIKNEWATNPGGGNWAAADFVASDNAFNLGYKSAT